MGADQSRVAVTPQGMSAGRLLFELQVEQHHHDETYHREIARLSMHQRLNHMALHFAKYTGKIARAQEADALPVYVDALIIALSTSNIINIDLWSAIEPDQREFLGLFAFGRARAIELRSLLNDRLQILQELTIATGCMAAACEKIDHLEEVSFCAEIKQSIARLSTLALAFIASRDVDPAHAIRERLDIVKRRLNLHGRI